jgi:hypothetical protein
MIYAMFLCVMIGTQQAYCSYVGLGTFASAPDCINAIRQVYGPGKLLSGRYYPTQWLPIGQRTQWVECEGKPTWSPVQ